MPIEPENMDYMIDNLSDESLERLLDRAKDEYDRRLNAYVKELGPLADNLNNFMKNLVPIDTPFLKANRKCG